MQYLHVLLFRGARAVPALGARWRWVVRVVHHVVLVAEIIFVDVQALQLLGSLCRRGFEVLQEVLERGYTLGAVSTGMVLWSSMGVQTLLLLVVDNLSLIKQRHCWKRPVRAGLERRSPVTFLGGWWCCASLREGQSEGQGVNVNEKEDEMERARWWLGGARRVRVRQAGSPGVVARSV